MKIGEIRAKLGGLVYYIDEIILYIKETGDYPENIQEAIDFIEKNKEEVLNVARQRTES